MARRWEFWSTIRLSKELASVPEPDHLDLLDAMDAYLKLEGVNYVVDDYEDGIKRIKHTNRSSGRCLFFVEIRADRGDAVLLALTIYKKETTGVPTSVLRRAKRRLKQWQERKTT